MTRAAAAPTHTTYNALDGQPRPPWLPVAARELRAKIHERKGRKVHNPRILEYHAATTLHASEDEVPWCASFVNWCLQRVGLTGTRSALAASFRTWGRALVAPRVGCVVVLARRDRAPDAETGSPTGMHVGFWMGQDGESTGDAPHGHVTVLGGNQSDAVTVAQFSLVVWEIVALRWTLGTTFAP